DVPVVSVPLADRRLVRTQVHLAGAFQSLLHAQHGRQQLDAGSLEDLESLRVALGRILDAVEADRDLLEDIGHGTGLTRRFAGGNAQLAQAFPRFAPLVAALR